MAGSKPDISFTIAFGDKPSVEYLPFAASWYGNYGPNLQLDRTVRSVVREDDGSVTVTYLPSAQYPEGRKVNARFVNGKDWRQGRQDPIAQRHNATLGHIKSTFTTADPFSKPAERAGDPPWVKEPQPGEDG